MMENNNDWFENLNYPSLEHQPQTFVTKHDLELLHKKIIATDLIVQKYQEVNRALLRLQVENDDFKQQIEQITNECCIFSKQVTECTQECDSLKEQLEISNNVKRELHQQIRLLQDENTNNHHEIMVLRQFESLKDTNDELTKTVERQQKSIGKLQLQLQRKSPVVYKPVRSKDEPSETDIALNKSEKSVRELRLALGRLVNFIQLSKIEIPTALNIRPVLKAHDITDDFLEIEGAIPRKPVKKVPKPVVSQIEDDDDDDDHGDFIDVNHSVPVPPPVNTADVIETVPLPSRQEEKKSKAKKTSRRKKDLPIPKMSPTKLDEVANELEIALSQSNLPASSLSDDDENDQTHKSDKQQLPQTNSTITISPNISFFSDDENETSPRKVPPIVEQQAVVKKQVVNSVQAKRSNKRPHHVSFLSEDDDEINQSMSAPVFVPSIKSNRSTVHENVQPRQALNRLSSIAVQEDLTLNQQVKRFSKTLPEPLLATQERARISSSISVNTGDSDRIQTVFRLLNVLTQVPVPLKPLGLIHRRKPQKTIPEEPAIQSTETRIDDEKIDPSIVEIPEPLETMEDSNPILENQISMSIEEPPKPTEEIGELLEIMEESNPILENQISMSIEEPPKPTEEIEEHPKPTEEIGEPPKSTEELEEHSKVIEVIEEQPKPTEEIEEPRKPAEEIEEHLKPMEEIEEPPKPTEEIEGQPRFAEEIEEHPKPTEEIEEPTKTTEELEQMSDDGTPIPIPDHLNPSGEDHLVEESSIENGKPHEQSQPTTEGNDTVVTEELQTIVEEKRDIEANGTTASDVYEEPKIIVEESSANVALTPDINLGNALMLPSLEQPTTIKESSVISTPQVSTPTVAAKPIERLLRPLVLESAGKSVLKPFTISIVTRLLNVLTNLPVKPLILPLPFLSRKRKQKSVVKKPSLPHPPQPSHRASRSPTRTQTRSLNSIRARIARCNQPAAISKKRPTTASISPSSTPSAKRSKPSPIPPKNNEPNTIMKFLTSSTKEMSDELKKILQKKLHETSSVFIDDLYRIVNELMRKKCNIKDPLVKQFQPYEESIRILLTFIHGQSEVFQKHWMNKLSQAFEYEIKQTQISSDQVKRINRLYFLTCSIFASSSSVIIYSRLFDIGYFLPNDILHDAIAYITNKCEPLISMDQRRRCSTILLHKTLFEILEPKQLYVSYEHLEDLFITYQSDTHDLEDFRRSLILICRHQSWSWCTKELCAKILFPLLENITDLSQRSTFLTILQWILSTYKDNEDFKRDTVFHKQLKQRLEALRTLTRDQCILRDNLFSSLNFVSNE